MRTSFCVAILLALTVTLPRSLSAQYWGERALEKGFEQTEFFFAPSNLIPYGIGSFKFTTPGLVDDPLLNLAVSPAHFWIDSLSDAYVYADFRSARTIQDQGYGYVRPWLAYSASDIAIRPYPWIYLNSRRELEPVFSGAYLGRLLPQTLPDLLVGATYQLILQDDKYYSVPQDIFRSVIGMDYAGNRVAAESIPIVDRYSGQDNMHQLGHFVSAFGRYEVPSLGSVGIKAGRAMFNRSGSFGSSNLWEQPILSTGTSLWSNLESRTQGYGHWELTAGADLLMGGQTSVGVTVGWLWGNATQALHRGDSSYYSYSSTSDRSYYVRSGNTQEEWRHNGRGFMLGADVTTHLTPKHTMHLLYQRQRTTVDLDLGSTIIDTSYSTYSSFVPEPPPTSTSYSILQDQRGGSGRQKTTTNRLLAALQWQLDERVNLALGAQLDWQTTETNTAESILARMRSLYQSSDGSYSYDYGTDESKDLHWAFKAERTSFRIPVFLSMKASEAISILLGLDRTMTRSRVDDVTLALFRYRQSNSNGTIIRQDNFGERYTQPTEEGSDVRTTFLAGLIAAPSSHFRIQLMMVPNFHETFEGSELEQLQWWIGFKIMP